MIELNERIIEKFFDGSCSESEMELLAQWFAESEENRKEWLKLRLAYMQSKFEHLSDFEHVKLSWEDLKRKRVEREMLEKRITRRVMLKFVRYAACVLFVMGISFVGYKGFQFVKYPQNIVLAVAEDEPTQKFLLEDSTIVWISAGSSLEYPKRFSSRERVVSADGKVYFEVFKDKQRPFLVQTETYIVKVLGTSFEVNSFKEERFSSVTLVEGSVDVLNKNKATLCRLHPGQQFELDRTNRHYYLSDINVDFYTSWRKGKIDFDGMSFKEILRGLEHFYNVKIVLDDSVNMDEQLVGSLTLKKDIHEMMKVLKRVVPFKYKIQTDTVIYINP